MTEPTPLDPGALNRYFDDFAYEVLQNYFNSGTYTGGRFERFAGGGDQPETADQFTSDDIVAVSFLGSRIPGRASLEILENGADDLSALLSQIPRDVDLWEAPEKAVGPGSPAAEVARHLGDLPGMSPMAAGNLLARKRPRLIPVYDRLVKVVLERPDLDSWWRSLRTLLAGRSPLVNLALETRQEANLGDDISVIRVFHVSMWMRELGRPDPVPAAESSEPAAAPPAPATGEKLSPNPTRATWTGRRRV